MKKSKILEFLTLISMSVGIVIGVGEFIKNDVGTPGNILFESQNALAAVILWIIIGISCIFMVLAFMEISSSTAKKSNGTTSNWISLFINRKSGSFVSLYWVFFYIPILYTLFSTMSVKYLLLIVAPGQFDTLSWASGSIYLFGSLFVFSFMTLGNALTKKPGKYLQIIGTFLKLIPFIMVLIIAVIPHSIKGGSALHIYKAPLTITSLFMTIGPILFSFDGFILATNLQKETKNKELINKSLITGIVIITIIYILEAIALFAGSKDGSVLTLFQNAFGQKIGTIFELMIVFALLLGLNGMTIAGPRFIFTDTNTGLLFSFGKKISLKNAGLIQIIISLLWFFPLILLGIFTTSGLDVYGKSTWNPAQYPEILSNVVVEFAFIFYMLILFACIVNRITNKIKVKKIKYMPILSSIGGTILLISTLAALVLTLKTGDWIIRGSMIAILFGNFILWIINEYLLNKYPVLEEKTKSDTSPEFSILKTETKSSNSEELNILKSKVNQKLNEDLKL